jgi:hypothetical protein
MMLSNAYHVEVEFTIFITTDQKKQLFIISITVPCQRRADQTAVILGRCSLHSIFSLILQSEHEHLKQ